jgi:hypothetical protein
VRGGTWADDYGEKEQPPYCVMEGKLRLAGVGWLLRWILLDDAAGLCDGIPLNMSSSIWSACVVKIEC